MKQKLSRLILILFFVFSLIPLNAYAQKVEIAYWQYAFKARVDAVDQLIKQFEAQNPNIRVKQTTFPYAQYRTKVAAAIPAGQGPDVVQLYYGWLDDYLKAKLLQPLSTEVFSPAEIEKEFFSITKAMKVDGSYYALPTAVRSLALFWNKKLFKEAGIAGPPQTLDEMIEIAKKITKRDSSGNLLTAGLTIAPTGQDHHWIREVFIRQFGGKPYSDDNKEVMFADPNSIKGISAYLDLLQKHKVSEIGFLTDGQTAFKAGKAGMTIDGSFRIAAFDKQRGLEYGIDELPSHNGIKSNFSSFWVNGITTKAAGDKKAAAEKFLKFLTTPEAMQLWLDTVGELPAKPKIALVEKNQKHPKFGPFIRGLAYAHTTKFVNESEQRKNIADMIDTVRLKNVDVATAVAEMAKKEQALLDKYNQ